MDNPDETGNDEWVSSNSEIENNQKHIDFDRLDQPDQTPAQFATKARKWVPLVAIIGIMALVGVLVTSIFLVGLPRVPQQPLNIPTTNLDKSPTSTSGSTQLTVPLGLAVSISNGVTYVASQAGTIYAINEKNGSQIWQYREYPASDNSPMPYFEKPYVIDGLVYVCSDRGSESSSLSERRQTAVFSPTWAAWLAYKAFLRPTWWPKWG